MKKRLVITALGDGFICRTEVATTVRGQWALLARSVVNRWPLELVARLIERPDYSILVRSAERQPRRRQFLGTHRCICGKRVRVYDWLPEQPLCRRCAAAIERDERAMQAPEENGGAR